MAVSSTFAHFFRFALCILICNRSNVKEKVFCGLYKSFLCLKLETRELGRKLCLRALAALAEDSQFLASISFRESNSVSWPL